jgi:hypothetical protein
MVAKEVFVNYHNFNPVWAPQTSIHVKKNIGTQVKKGTVIVKVSYKIYSEPGLELEPEPKEIISAPQHWFVQSTCTESNSVQ